MTIKRIYWFAYYNLSCPSVRYRGKYVLDELKKSYGIPYSFVVPGYQLKTILHFVRVYFSALFFRERNSVIVFQKIYSKGLYAALLKLLLILRKKNTLYDLDDAEYLRFPLETIHFFLRHCTTCSVGSEVLAVYARKYNAQVLKLTSPVIEHGIAKSKRNAVFTLGWIGYYNTTRESSKEFSGKKVLEEFIFPAMHKIDFKLKLVLLGVTFKEDRKELENYFSSMKNITLEMPDHINWQDENSVYNRIREFDAGVAALLDCEMHRAKSAFKLKQYLSCGVPVLANDVGENTRFLHNGVNGYLCNSPAAFYEMILKLYKLSDEDYNALSANAEKSSPEFSMNKYCSALVEYYASIK